MEKEMDRVIINKIWKNFVEKGEYKKHKLCIVKRKDFELRKGISKVVSIIPSNRLLSAKFKPHGVGSYNLLVDFNGGKFLEVYAGECRLDNIVTGEVFGEEYILITVNSARNNKLPYIILKMIDNRVLNKNEYLNFV